MPSICYFKEPPMLKKGRQALKIVGKNKNMYLAILRNEWKKSEKLLTKCDNLFQE